MPKTPPRKSQKSRKRIRWYYRIDIVAAIAIAKSLVAIGLDVLRFFT